MEVLTGPKPADSRTDHDLFRTEHLNLIDQRHELVQPAELIDWQAFADEWSPQSVATAGRPALLTRWMPALLYLKHVYALSDEDTVRSWQRFSGKRYFVGPAKARRPGARQGSCRLVYAANGCLRSAFRSDQPYANLSNSTGLRSLAICVYPPAISWKH